ncbi:hypothetical protein ACMHYB_09030 [Sorangium sp. So ce1128]
MRHRQIEHQEFECIRHGTVNFVTALVVHTGRTRGWFIELAACVGSHRSCLESAAACGVCA